MEKMAMIITRHPGSRAWSGDAFPGHRFFSCSRMHHIEGYIIDNTVKKIMIRPQSALIINNETKWVGKLTLLLKELDIHNICSASDKGEALEALERSRFDLVIVEVEPPEKEAVSLIKEIQQIDGRTRIIAFSTNAKRQVVLDCVYAGALQYILKSDDLLAIRNKIMTVTERVGSRYESTNKSSRTQFNSFY